MATTGTTDLSPAKRTRSRPSRESEGVSSLPPAAGSLGSVTAGTIDSTTGFPDLRERANGKHTGMDLDDHETNEMDERGEGILSNQKKRQVLEILTA
jgi:hypothetical protein